MAISLGSLAELETHLEIARRLNYTDPNTIHNLFDRTDEIGRMLTGLKKSLK
ncbi:MAG: four helix bundle protein [Candidatus Marinimicrobia bacterium]|nr:four helix bundle protein [Candidatus Neomarinimicrobiota bacterium]